jgi:PIN domain nuclease of toxin-antitoxin system
MRFLIDTHVLLWYLLGDSRISDRTKSILESKENKLFLSKASLWEIAIKMSIGKLLLNVSLTELSFFLIDQGFEILDFNIADLEKLQSLPFIHKDPFDRLIIAQAKTKSLKLISYDSKIEEYFTK